MLKNYLFPNRKQEKNPSRSTENLSKIEKLRKETSIFFKNVSGKSGFWDFLNID